MKLHVLKKSKQQTIISPEVQHSPHWSQSLARLSPSWMWEPAVNSNCFKATSPLRMRKISLCFHTSHMLQEAAGSQRGSPSWHNSHLGENCESRSGYLKKKVPAPKKQTKNPRNTRCRNPKWGSHDNLRKVAPQKTMGGCHSHIISHSAITEFSHLITVQVQSQV